MSSDETETKKSFWAHISDLRVALVRSAMAIGIAMVVCLLVVKHIVAVLQYPLQNMDMFHTPKPTVSFKVGEHRVGPYVVTREQFPALPQGEAPQAVYEISSMQVGAEQVPTLKLLPPETTRTPDSLRVKLYNFSPAEGFMVAFHVALYSSLVVASPVWIYQLLAFLVPALNRTEKKMLLPWMFWGVVLFLFGVLSTYFVLLPLALTASMEYSDLLGFDGTMWRADDYIRFATRFIFGMGVGFQFPLIVLFLVKLGILHYKQLMKYRRHVFLACFILGAILTTPEWITQVSMAVPMYILYEICIIIAWYWDRKKRKSGEIIEV